jgi:hypothetical protein
MPNDLIIRIIEPDDCRGLSHLFEDVFGRKIDTGYWRWKYFQNPGGEPMMLIAASKGRVIASFGIIPQQIKLGQMITNIAQGVDIAVAKDFRKSGILFKLERKGRDLCKDKDIIINYAISIQKTFPIFTRFANFSDICSIVNLAKVINPVPYLQRQYDSEFLSRLTGSSVRLITKLINKKKVINSNKIKIADIQQFDQRFDSLWQRVAPKYKVITVRDRKYLNWRYLEAPLPYKIYSAEKDGSLEGYIVLICIQEEVRRGRIIDMLVDSDQDEVAEMLIQSAVNHFLDKQVDAICCWMLAHWPSYQIFKKKGFLARRTPYNLLVRTLQPLQGTCEDHLMNASEWYLTEGDSDFH